MLHLADLFHQYNGLDNDDQFAQAVTDIWQIGSLKEIRNQVSDEVFTFHIAVNVVGNWQSDGWGFIFAEGSSLLPYISDALEKIGLIELKSEFDRTFMWLTAYFNHIGVPFMSEDGNSDRSVDTDTCNFLLNPRFKIGNAVFNQVSPEERKLVSQTYHQHLENLDAISEELWGYGVEQGGWQMITAYLAAIRNRVD